MWFACVAVAASAPADMARAGDENRPAIKVLFLGDDGPHQPAERFPRLAGPLAARGIELTYTARLADLNPKTLADYDALAIYANIVRIEPEQERALLDFVAGGKGVVALHCASFCFHNSPAYIELVGAQFHRHAHGTFGTTVIAPEHPLVRDYGGFTSWDETYIHHRHNERDRTVLEVRNEADTQEPYTWVRRHGQGRVFYTAWGHDSRTWGHRGFHNLVERGIRWAAGRDVSVVPPFHERSAMTPPEMTAKRADVKPFEYREAKIAFYPPGGDRTGGGEWNQMQLPLDTAESMKHFVTPVGFHVELFASEPLITAKPISMNWDERGRLWVIESLDYPNEQKTDGVGRDQIRILEDTDGDGRADRSTLFADKLSIPTSLIFARGGVIVHQAPKTYFLRDTDGDDRADTREVLIEGWGTRDTHSGPSNLRYGLDNWLWCTVGYSGFEGEVAGERHSFKPGIVRFLADGSRLEFVRSTNNNTWGLGISEEGLILGSTANRNPSIYMPIANRYYEQVRGRSASVLGTIANTHLLKPITDRVRQVDHHIGYTAAAGGALYTARTYPSEYWNRAAFVSDPTAHLTGTFILERDGADFHSNNLFNLVASDDEWSAPILAEVGPDGHVWIIDWYNYIVQHNPTPIGFETGKGNAYETELRDKSHGRVYRVVYDTAEPPQPMTLAGASPEKLVSTLAHPNMFWRLHAQRLLVERGRLDDVRDALLALVADTRLDDIELNPGAIHALWTLAGLGGMAGDDAPGTAAAIAALAHPSAGVRRNAVMTLPPTGGAAAAILNHGALEDHDPQVRLAALLALADAPASDAAGAAVARMIARDENAGDAWIPDAAIAAGARSAQAFLNTLASVNRESHASAFITRAPRFAQVVAAVAEHHAHSAPVDTVAALVVALPNANTSVAEGVIEGLARGWPGDRAPALDERLDAALLNLAQHLPSRSRTYVSSLGAAWGSKALVTYADELSAQLAGVLEDTSKSDDERVSAARQIIELGPTDATAAARVLAAITPRTSPALAIGMIDALGLSEAEVLGARLVDQLAGMSPAVRAAAVRVLLSRRGWTAALLDGFERSKAQLADLSLDQRQALAAHPLPPLARRAQRLLSEGGGLPSPDRQAVLTELMPLTTTKGDATAGKLVFTNQCAKCHTHSGEGAKIGPDLTGMAVHPKAELLLNIVDPSRGVEGNYRVYTVLTTDGLIINGLLTSETKTTIELVDAEAKPHVVLRDDIELLQTSPKSLMPEGFEKTLNSRQWIDLLEFLTARGRYMPLPLDKAATVVSTKGMFGGGDRGPDRLVFDDWGPKTVEGVPFTLVDPRGTARPNVILLNGPKGTLPPVMPRSARVPCHAAAKAIHVLGGVSGWGYPISPAGGTSMVARLRYEDGASEDHPLINGVHMADYIRRVDVEGSRFAFLLGEQQVRWLSILPKRDAPIGEIEFIKGDDETAPLVLAVTVELR